MTVRLTCGHGGAQERFLKEPVPSLLYCEECFDVVWDEHLEGGVLGGHFRYKGRKAWDSSAGSPSPSSQRLPGA